MNDLRDTRPLVGRTTTDHCGNPGRYALAASEAIFELLSGNPGVDPATIRIVAIRNDPPSVRVTGRVGSLADNRDLEIARVWLFDAHPSGEPAYPCCGQLAGRPHTDYCENKK